VKPLYRKTLLRFLPIVFNLERANQIEPYQVTKNPQRNLCRKKKGSKRREKARKRVAKIHAKIKDTRTDFLQKLSKKIVRENQTIILEYVNTSGMVKNSKLALAIECVKIKTLADKFPGSDASKIN